MDHLQGSLTQVHEEVTQNSEDLCEIEITLIQALRVTLRLFPVIFLQLTLLLGMMFNLEVTFCSKTSCSVLHKDVAEQIIFLSLGRFARNS